MSSGQLTLTQTEASDLREAIRVLEEESTRREHENARQLDRIELIAGEPGNDPADQIAIEDAISILRIALKDATIIHTVRDHRRE